MSPAPPAAPDDAASYWALTADVPAASEELWGLFCYEHGALGAETLHESGGGTGHARLRFFFGQPLPAPPARLLEAFRTRYPAALPPWNLKVTQHRTEPWESAWRVHFEPLPVGQRLLICPPWAADAPAGRVPVVIEPGQGFGTGRHPSTALALELLEQRLGEGAPPAALLDAGTGSGILALAACRLGVGAAWVLDVDARALPEVRRNFALNALAPPRAVVCGTPACLRGRFALVTANIVTPVLLAHGADLAALTAPDGCLILSGVLAREGPELLGRYAALGMAPAAEARREEWVAYRLRHCRRDHP